MYFHVIINPDIFEKIADARNERQPYVGDCYGWRYRPSTDGLTNLL